MKRFVVIGVVLCVGWPAVAQAEGSNPDYRRIRSALERSTGPSRFTVSAASISAMRPARVQLAGSVRRDSVWNGLLIGAAIGAVGGWIWARNLCGSNDSECFAIAAPVGMLGGGGIGAAVGAIADALHK